MDGSHNPRIHHDSLELLGVKVLRHIHGDTARIPKSPNCF
jgi:hypothetical protein